MYYNLDLIINIILNLRLKIFYEKNPLKNFYNIHIKNDIIYIYINYKRFNFLFINIILI
jgi:hypothetical protein